MKRLCLSLLAVLVLAVAVISAAPNGETGGEVRLVLVFKKALLGAQKTPVEVTGDIKLGKVASKGHLSYPPDVLAEGIGGTVEVGLVVDQLGRVTEAKILAGVDPRLDALCLEAARGLSFEPSTRKDGQAVGLAVVAVYTFAPAGEPKPTPATGVKPGWEKEFKQVYGLGEGEVLKLVHPPFPSSRMDFYRTSSPRQAEAIPEGPDTMTVWWDPKNGQLESQGFVFGGSELVGLLSSLGIERYAISGDPKVLHFSVPGDLVLRKGATVEEYVPALEGILRSEYKQPIRMSFKTEDRDVIIAKGRYVFRPLQVLADTSQVHIYHLELDKTPGSSGGGTAPVSRFLEILAETLGHPVVSEVEPSKATVHYAVHNDSLRTAYVDDVLRNISAQTGLVFEHQTRPVRILVVEQAP